MKYRVPVPGSRRQSITLTGAAEKLAHNLVSIFRRDAEGRRPVFGDNEKFQNDPHWRDHLLFYEYFHGDNGAGLGASHQTGWTGVVARLMHLFAVTPADELLEMGRQAPFTKSVATEGEELADAMSAHGK